MHNQLTEKRSGRPKRRTEPSHTLRVNESLYFALGRFKEKEYEHLKRSFLRSNVENENTLCNKNKLLRFLLENNS